MSAYVSQVLLAGIPHVTDEVSYTLQARLFAGFSRVGPIADNASMWQLPFWSVEGPMFSPFPPGWPAVLSIGESVHLGAWVNPLLSCFLPLVVYRIGVSVLGGKAAKIAAVVVALSPGVWLLAGSRMAHTSVLLALGMVMACAVSARNERSAWLLGALGAAYVVLARPFDAALLAGPLLVMGWSAAQRSRMLWAWVGLPTLAAMLLFADNAFLTGDPFRFPMSDWFDAWQGRQGCNRLGFGADVGCSPTLGGFGHDPLKAMHLAWESLLRFDRLLLGFHGGTVLALWGAWKMKARRGWVWVLLIVVGYGLYWSPGRAYGARFWHPIYLVVPLALAHALAPLKPRLTGFLLVGLSLGGLSQVQSDLTDRYWCVDNGLQSILAEAGVEEGVVFLLGKGQRSTEWPTLGVERFQCDPMLESGDGWALINPSSLQAGLQVRHALPDIESTQAFMEAHHPGRASWLVTHDVSRDIRTIKSLGILAPR